MRSMSYVTFLKALGIVKESYSVKFKVTLPSDEELLAACKECVNSDVRFFVNGNTITVWSI